MNFLELTTAAINFPMLAAGLALSTLLGFCISIVYTRTNRSRGRDASFKQTLIVLPAVITSIILLVGTNVASAFSLAGAFSIIRFRSEPGQSKDLVYVLVAMAVGLACGMGMLIYASAIGVFMIALMIVLERSKQPGDTFTLKIVMPEDVDYMVAYESSFDLYAASHRIERAKTTELGSLYEVTYHVRLKEAKKEKEFIDSIRARNGNLPVTLSRSVE